MSPYYYHMAPITLDWLQIVALLGAAQGAFLTGILATQRRNRTANRLLAAAMLAFSIQLATTVYYRRSWSRSSPISSGCRTRCSCSTGR
ncbi:MAG: hypothetical protein E4H38_08210 [Gemmatimonadales bacterium]|nr:MAG: hypothetical protein E4H38_08210 [Gemmatimonadales bacterium]